MDPVDIVAEYMQAKQEHEEALAAVDAMRAQLEIARSEYADAKQVELQMEQDVQQATADLQTMHLDVPSDADGATDTTDIPATTTADAPTACAGSPVLSRVSDFLVEYHRNIGCYHCYLFVDDGAYDQLDPTTLSVQVDFPHVKLLAHSERLSGASTSGKVWWTTEIERNVEPANCVIDVKYDVVCGYAIPQSDHLYLRLPVKDGDKDVSGDGFSSFSQITSKELDKTHYGTITCRACDNVLLHATRGESPIEKVLPLPSANWMDMFDFWGAGNGGFEHIPREDIFAQAARVYVGESHILLHASDTVPNALERAAALTDEDAQSSRDVHTVDDEEGLEGDDDTNHSWQPLRCNKCSTALGMRHSENVQTIRLDKHLISSTESAAEAQEDIFERYTIDSIVCTKLLESADSDGVFRYTLRATEEGTAPTAPPSSPALQLQLLSWETMIKVNSSPEFRRVLKVLYTAKLAETPTSSAVNLPLSVPAQDLIFAPAICDAIASRLRKSSTLLPTSLRTFNKTDVGYLYA